MTDQVGCELEPLGAGPQVGKRDDLAAALHDAEVESRQVVRAKRPERESLLSAGLQSEPLFRNQSQAVHDRRGLTVRDDTERNILSLESPDVLPLLAPSTAMQLERR